MIKKLISRAIVLVVPFLLPVQVVCAQAMLANLPNPVKYNTLDDIISAAGSLVTPIVIIALIVMIMYGGWTWMTARDDEKAIGRAKAIIMAAIVGFGIIVLAPVIVKFAGSLFGVQQGLLDYGS